MITLPEKLASMTPYDPCEDVYQIKLDANESYFSLPEELRDAIAASIDTIDFNRYPDPTVADVRRLAGREFRIAPGNIVVGNGSDELISLIMNTFAPRGGKVMVLSPDFSMYQFYAEVAELEVVNMLKDGEFMLTEQQVIDRAKEEKPDILIKFLKISIHFHRFCTGICLFLSSCRLFCPVCLICAACGFLNLICFSVLPVRYFLCPLLLLFPFCWKIMIFC